MTRLFNAAPACAEGVLRAVLTAVTNVSRVVFRGRFFAYT